MSTNDHRDRLSILRSFEQLRVFQRGERRAVHKPLLLLFWLARLERGAPRMVEFSEIDIPFKRLLSEFGPSSAAGSRHYPFWHLRSDGIWDLAGPVSLLSRAAGATPTLGEMRATHLSGGFAADLDARLRADSGLRRELILLLLDAHFPTSLHADIASELGLDLNAPPLSVEEDAAIEIGNLSRPRRRDPAFRERVLRAYEHRCCVCGFSIRIGSLSAGLEAAHIQWHTAEGPDVEPNGLALCALHHKLFDLGAFTIVPETFAIVFSQHAIAGDATRSRMLFQHGEKLLMPQGQDQRPQKQYLGWHQQEVFKRPGRDLPVGDSEAGAIG